jgi:PAS domain S-box-containing protein
MLRTSPPVVATTDTLRSRARRSHPAPRHARAPSQYHRSLRPSDFGLGPLFVHTRDALIVGDLENGRIVLWNPAAERLFGWAASEAIGRPIEIVIAPAFVRLHQEGLALHRRTGHGTLMGFDKSLEVPAMTRSGDEIFVELSLAPLDKSRRAERKYVLAMLRDVSDRRRAEMHGMEAAQARSATCAAEATVREHQQVVAEGVNDLKGELRRLRRSAQSLTRELGQAASDHLARRARVIAGRTDRLRRVLDELASSAVLQAGQLEPGLERVNLVPLLSQVVAETRQRGLPHRLNVAMPQGLTAVVDPDLVEHAVRTVLERVLARNPRGCWIDVELRRPLTGLARLEVREFGGPVSEAERRALGELPRTDPGLALCRSIIEQHRGTLSVEFPVEGGVAVVMTLPTQRGRAAANSAAS